MTTTPLPSDQGFYFYRVTVGRSMEAGANILVIASYQKKAEEIGQKALEMPDLSLVTRPCARENDLSRLEGTRRRHLGTNWVETPETRRSSFGGCYALAFKPDGKQTLVDLFGQAFPRGQILSALASALEKQRPPKIDRSILTESLKELGLTLS